MLEEAAALVAKLRAALDAEEGGFKVCVCVCVCVCIFVCV